MLRFCLLFCVFATTGIVSGDDVPNRRVLWIGIDGCRPDALQKAQTPSLDSLKAKGAWSYETRIQDSYRKSDTSSGPGWSSFLTGVWADKHGVHDNSFEGRSYEQFPHVFTRVKERWPDAVTASFVDWEPINEFIVQDCDHRVCYPAHGAEQYAGNDLLLAREAAEFLRDHNPHAMMVYFGAVDETGHATGFHPDNQDYVHAIETVDERVGEVLTALNARPDFDSEDWLVVVSTDHGGKDKGHGGGQNVPEIYTTFIIVSGAAADHGAMEEPTFLVDVPVTGLVHLGIDPPPEWKLDGRPIGLKNSPIRSAETSPSSTPLKLSWKDRFLTISGDHIPGGPIQIHYLEAYCRPGSTDRDWRETVIPHQSELVDQAEDGSLIRLRDRLADGVIVDHTIQASADDVTFTVVAQNPTLTPSEAHWAQPCLRVDGFTGCDPADSRKTFPPYIRKCFVMLEGRIQRLPTEPWALKARYIPGQVYAAGHVDRDDVNPRPLSTLVPTNGLTGCYSKDETMILATAWKPWQEVFQGVITCMHNDFRIGGLQPGASKTIRGKLYVVPADEEMLLRRFRQDFGPASP